jgi:DNA-binding NarL/FixJ family response regulator
LSLLIADHPPTRHGLRIALDEVVSICAEADDAQQAIQAAQREQPDVCLVGLEMPGGGLAATRGICEVAPEAAVIILAASPDFDDLMSCVKAGAVGYVSSDIGPDSLRRTVLAVHEGEAAVPRSMQLDLVRELQGPRFDEPGGLTPRESQVLNMLRRGRSTAAIANRLGISPVTVRRHISSTIHKAGVEDREKLAREMPPNRPNSENPE